MRRRQSLVPHTPFISDPLPNTLRGGNAHNLSPDFWELNIGLQIDARFFFIFYKKSNCDDLWVSWTPVALSIVEKMI